MKIKHCTIKYSVNPGINCNRSHSCVAVSASKYSNANLFDDYINYWDRNNALNRVTMAQKRVFVFSWYPGFMLIGNLVKHHLYPAALVAYFLVSAVQCLLMFLKGNVFGISAGFLFHRCLFLILIKLLKYEERWIGNSRKVFLCYVKSIFSIHLEI